MSCGSRNCQFWTGSHNPSTYLEADCVLGFKGFDLVLKCLTSWLLLFQIWTWQRIIQNSTFAIPPHWTLSNHVYNICAVEGLEVHVTTASCSLVIIRRPALGCWDYVIKSLYHFRTNSSIADITYHTLWPLTDSLKVFCVEYTRLYTQHWLNQPSLKGAKAFGRLTFLNLAGEIRYGIKWGPHLGTGSLMSLIYSYIS